MYYAWLDTTDVDMQPGEVVSVRVKRRKSDGSHEYYDSAAKKWVATDAVPLLALKASMVNGVLCEWSDWCDWPEVSEPTAVDYIHPRLGLLFSDGVQRRRQPPPRAMTMIF